MRLHRFPFFAFSPSSLTLLLRLVHKLCIQLMQFPRAPYFTSPLSSLVSSAYLPGSPTHPLLFFACPLSGRSHSPPRISFSDTFSVHPHLHSDQSNYEITCKLGRGKYSEVFEGVDIRTEKNIVVKILKVSAGLRRQGPLLQRRGRAVVSLLSPCPLPRPAREKEEDQA